MWWFVNLTTSLILSPPNTYAVHGFSLAQSEFYNAPATFSTPSQVTYVASTFCGATGCQAPLTPWAGQTSGLLDICFEGISVLSCAHVTFLHTPDSLSNPDFATEWGFSPAANLEVWKKVRLARNLRHYSWDSRVWPFLWLLSAPKPARVTSNKHRIICVCVVLSVVRRVCVCVVLCCVVPHGKFPSVNQDPQCEFLLDPQRASGWGS